MRVLKNNAFSTYPTLVSLSLACLLIWAWVLVLYFFQKTDFLDDAYIYLHIANNILDLGTAQFYPVSENSSLLASSPLRMLLLVPATAIARLLTVVDLSDATMRLTLYISGWLTALLFLPFFLKRLKYWGYGVLFSGGLALATLSALQMEGLLIFWVTYTLAVLMGEAETQLDAALWSKAGYLTSLLVLTRPEYGIVAGLLLFSIVLYQRKWRWLARYVIPLAICGGAWMVMAILLKVWFIPTTYLSKIITAQLQMFSPDFYYVLPVQFNHFFLFNQFTLDEFFVPYVFLAVYFVLLIKLSHFYRFFVLFIALLLAVLAKSAGNYIWYHENFFTVIVTVGFVIILQYLKPKVEVLADNMLVQVNCLNFKRALLPVVLSLILVSLFITSSATQHMTLILPYKALSAEGYRNIAAHHVGNGVFEFPDLPPTYIKMMEIGVVSYYGGSSIWINDLGGLAQAGTLEGATTSRFAAFFPNALLITGETENIHMCQQSALVVCPIHTAWALPEGEDTSKVQYHYKELYFGLNSDRVIANDEK